MDNLYNIFYRIYILMHICIICNANITPFKFIILQKTTITLKVYTYMKIAIYYIK